MAAPATPANLSIDVVASNTLQMSWDNVAGETGFYLYRSLDDATYYKIISLAADVLSYWDRDVGPATQYYYKVSAYNNDGESALSASVNDTTDTQSLVKYWYGSLGPFYYDANAKYKGEDVNMVGVRSAGHILSDVVPTLANHVLRKDDIGSVGLVAPADAQYVVIALSGGLSAERRLQGGDILSLTDGGADGDVTLDVDYLDEDDMASDSAVHVPTQQSVKAYVDAEDDRMEQFAYFAGGF